MSSCNYPGCTVGIAIVEDEKALVRLYEKAFIRKNIKICFIAYDGIDAIKDYIVCSPRPHAVLMDYRLPVMNGLEAMKEILKIDPDAKVVFLSADIAVRDEAMRGGAYAFLKKPASITDITSVVERAINAGLRAENKTV